MNIQRSAGVLLPITALPSPHGVGTLGKAACELIDFLHGAGVGVWQILPVGPTGYGDSPYQSCSAFAGNEYLIDLDLLIEDGLLTEKDLASVSFGDNPRRVNYGKLFENRLRVLEKAFQRFSPEKNEEYRAVCADEELFEYALFCALRARFDYAPWSEWPEEYRDRNPSVLSAFYREHRAEVELRLFAQYLFRKQFSQLRKYAASRGVRIFGDMPLYVSYDSVDVWKYRDRLFRLNPDGSPEAVAGVPPDAFCDDGQLWGNPLFDWERMKTDGYDWWNRRIRDAFRLYDMLRIDHFRGFDRYFAIPTGESAKCGKWVDGPKFDFFRDKRSLPIVAEDLGVIDDGVLQLMEQTGYPGMKVLSFAFGGDPFNPYLPSRFGENAVVYTGTHDNLPIKGMLELLDDEQFACLLRVLKAECNRLGICVRTTSARALTDRIAELAFASCARLAIVPMWDLLRVGEEGRINYPSTLSDRNWSYRYLKREFSPTLQSRLRTLTERYGRNSQE